MLRGLCFVLCLCGVVSLFTMGGCDPVTNGNDASEKTSPDASKGLQPTLSSIQANIFEKSCSFSSCHGGGAGGMSLKDGESFKALVGVDSSNESGMKRVVAGDPANSLLLKVLKEQVGSVRQMPPAASLAQAKIDAIEQWIKNGAKDD